MRKHRQTSTLIGRQLYHFLAKEKPNGNFRTEKYNNNNKKIPPMDELSSGMRKTEERVSKFEDRSVEIVQYEQ